MKALSRLEGGLGGGGYALSFYGLEGRPEVLAFRIIGYLDARNSEPVRTELEGRVAGGARDIVLDCSSLDYISSTGIAVLEGLRRMVMPRGGSFALIHPSELVGGILGMYGCAFGTGIDGELSEALAGHDFREDALSPSYPLLIRCPVCSRSLRIPKPMLFACPACQARLRANELARIALVSGPAETSGGQSARGGKPAQGGLGARNYPLRISGENELVALLAGKEDHYSHCISIGNPDQGIPEIIEGAFVEVLRLGFYDVDSAADLAPGQEPRIPELGDASRVIEFFRRTQATASGYEVHCWQGISRSTAVGLALLSLMACPEAELAQALLALRPQAIPHRRLAGFFGELLGSDLSGVAARIREERMGQWRRDLEALGPA